MLTRRDLLSIGCAMGATTLLRGASLAQIASERRTIRSA